MDQLLSLFVKPGFASPVDVSIIPDFKNSDRYAASAGQATLGMPSREYYLDDSAKMKAHRAAYRNYIITIEKLAGLPGGEAADRRPSSSRAVPRSISSSCGTRRTSSTPRPSTR